MKLTKERREELENMYHSESSECVHSCDRVKISELRALLAAAEMADVLEVAIKDIAKQRTVAEWEKFAEVEGLDPDGADYTGAYDAAVRTARAAAARLGYTIGGKR